MLVKNARFPKVQNIYEDNLKITFFNIPSYSIQIPNGNTQSLGGYQECLSKVHHEFVDSNTSFNIVGQ